MCHLRHALAHGQGDVHQNDIGDSLGNRGQRFLTVSIRTDAGEAVGLADLGREVVADPVVVFDDSRQRGAPAIEILGRNQVRLPAGRFRENPPGCGTTAKIPLRRTPPSFKTGS